MTSTLLLYRLHLRTLVTKARLVGLFAVGLAALGLGLALRFTNHPETRADRVYTELITTFGLNLIVPVTALVFASAAFGDPTDDKTMVYLWLTPVPRWRLVASALAASLTIAIPVAVIPLAAATILAGSTSRVVLATSIGSAFATVAYTAVFLGLGLRVRRALAWGLAYLLIWELAVARAAKGAAKLSISVYSRSLLAKIADHVAPKNGTSLAAAVIVPPLVIVAALVLTTWWLARAEVA
jgi:ABC-2 type transport system permease protein